MPTDDELLRLVNELAAHGYEDGGGYSDIEEMMADMPTLAARRAALLAHIAANYVRRPQVIYPQEPEVGEFFENVDLGITQHWNGEQWVPIGRYRASPGVMPWRAGDELPEVAIRRMRDGTD